jgi:GNAT superfamily N-acetyltransferase
VSEIRRVEKSRRDHPVEGFDCGHEELNRYLLRYAWQNQQAGGAQTYVGIVSEVIVCYHTLAVGQVTLEDAPERLKKGLAKHPVPIMLLARLAIDHRWQGQGVGKALLRDAMNGTLHAADIAGIRALAVHAKDEEARHFYQHFDFLPRQTPCISLFCLRTCGGLSRNQELHEPAEDNCSGVSESAGDRHIINSFFPHLQRSARPPISRTFTFD